MEFNWGVGYLFGGLQNSPVLNIHSLKIWVVQLLVVYIRKYIINIETLIVEIWVWDHNTVWEEGESFIHLLNVQYQKISLPTLTLKY